MLYKERPKDGRSQREEAVYDVLEKLLIEFERVDHEAARTIEDCKMIDEELGTKICKNLFLCNRQKTDFYLLLMDGDKRFVTKNFSKTIGSSRLSFASEESLLEILNVTPGSASILGLIFDVEKRVKLYIDKDVAEGEYLGCHPCMNTSSLKIKTSDIFDKFLPYVGTEPHIVEISSGEELV